MRFLDATRKPSTVIGGVAVIAHGFARFTADIDAAVVARPTEVPSLLRAARGTGLSPRIPDAEQFARDNLVLLLEHTETKVPVDVSLALQPFEREAAQHAELRRVGDADIRVPPLTALLIYKMVAGRAKDVEDVKALLATGAPYDRQAVESALSEFDVVLETARASDFRRLVDG